MKKLFLAGLACAAALAATTPAQAHPNWHFRGGCGFTTLSDGTDSPQTKWDGEIHVTAVATDAAGNPAPTATIRVDCVLIINGQRPGTVVFSCSTPGTGFVACAGQFSFHADPDDIVEMCDQVTVNDEFHDECGTSTTMPLVPEQVQDILDEQVWPTVDPTIETVFTTVDDIVKEYIDPHACAATIALDESAADEAPIDIRDDGDVFIDGEWFWDCPEYDVAGS